MKIKIKPFASDEAGFLRRNLRIARLQKRVEKNDLDALEEMVKIFAERVEGMDADAAFEALLDLSQDDFNAMTAAMVGGGADPLV